MLAGTLVLAAVFKGDVPKEEKKPAAKASITRAFSVHTA
jgi:hypothetical protein